MTFYCYRLQKSGFQPVAVDKWKIVAPNGNVLKEVTNASQLQFEVLEGITGFTVLAQSNSLCNGEQTEQIEVLERSAPTGIEGEFAICKNTQYHYKAKFHSKSRVSLDSLGTVEQNKLY